MLNGAPSVVGLYHATFKDSIESQRAFLPNSFRKIASAERVDDDEDAANKRARLSPIDEVSVGKAKSLHFKISLVGQVSLVAYPSTFRTGVVGQIICVLCSCR